MNRMHQLGLLAAGAVAVVGWAQGQKRAQNLAPKHEVLTHLDGQVELRQYGPTVVARTAVDGSDWLENQREAFKRLASYIFGGNHPRSGKGPKSPAPAASPEAAQGQRIPMIAPVLVEGDAEHQEMCFLMPDGLRLDQLPEPDDARVHLERLPEKRVAVLGFSWWATPERMAERGEALIQAVERAGLKIRGPLMLAQYDDPMTLPFLRRNEVMIELVA